MKSSNALSTATAERHEIAREWLGGNYEHHRRMAESHGLLPIALIIASLIDMDHPLLVSGRGVYLNSVEASVKIVQIMASKHTESYQQPVDNS
jgi:hypothetical protein